MMQEVNAHWRDFIKEAAPRSAATPAIQTAWERKMMMIWRTDVMTLQKTEWRYVFPDDFDRENRKRNWRVFQKARSH